MTVLFVIFTILLGLWLFARAGLEGADLTAFDEPRPEDQGDHASPEHAAVVARIQELGRGRSERMSRDERVRKMREGLERAFGDAEVGAEIRAVDAGGVPSEWVLAPGADPRKRILYLHGGAFMAGSPKSHRPLTARLSADNGAAVLSVDYRLMPENRRLDCLTDCCTAYRWILANGPDGTHPADTLFVGGDSAGGNLTLAVIAWARDQRLQAANAAVAFSPLTDSTYGSPAIRTNLETDVMLAEAFRLVERIPRWIMLWGNFLIMRVRPQDERVSPVYGSLAGLPPVLVQASSAEVLVDDGRRWVNKARSEGTDATFQTWPGMVHVFQAFVPDLPEANQALGEVKQFFAGHTPAGNPAGD